MPSNAGALLLREAYLITLLTLQSSSCFTYFLRHDWNTPVGRLISQRIHIVALIY